MTTYFNGSEYHTPEDKKIYRREKILPGNFKGFYKDYFSRLFALIRIIKKGKYTYQAYAQTSKNIFDDIEGHGGKIHIEGLDNLRQQEGPVVFAANHMGVMETQLLTSIIAPKKVAFVIKASLLDQPFFKHIMRAVYNVPVKRQHPLEDMKVVMEKGKELLDQGISIIIFPEGTRKDYFSPLEFNSLAVKLASSAEVPLIPLALKTNFWGQGKKIKDLGPLRRDIPIHFSFGQALKPQGRGKKEHQITLQFLEDKLKSWDFPIK